MTEQEKKIMQTCGALVANMSELEKEKFLSFTEGMAFLSSRRRDIMLCDSAAEQQRQK